MNKRFRSLILFAIVGSWGAPVCPQGDAVDSLIAVEMKRQRIPGLALVVVRDGETVKSRAYGLANFELNTPASTDTVFEIASITKPFAAQAVLLLVEDGKLSLEDRIPQFLKDPPTSWSMITIRQLLNHTSGLDRDPFPLTRELTGRDFTSLEIIEKGSKLPLLFGPGIRFSYSNIGYFLLGKIIERASGRQYAEFLEARVFKPLGLVSSRVNDRSAIIPHRAAGYDTDAQEVAGDVYRGRQPSYTDSEKRFDGC
jgi:D-alanyl-D-alanine carboxypeptidase